MNQHFIKQFEFEKWSNTLILNSLKQLNTQNKRAISLFSHLLSSHSMWLSRLTKTDFTCTLFQERSLDECEKLIEKNYLGWMKYLENCNTESFYNSIDFMSAWEENPSKRQIKIDDALIHLINHSSYHRGQIVASLKGEISPLPLSTYIIYASEVI